MILFEVIRLQNDHFPKSQLLILLHVYHGTGGGMYQVPPGGLYEHALQAGICTVAAARMQKLAFGSEL